jgi:hypothetical protein
MVLQSPNYVIFDRSAADGSRHTSSNIVDVQIKAGLLFFVVVILILLVEALVEVCRIGGTARRTTRAQSSLERSV